MTPMRKLPAVSLLALSFLLLSSALAQSTAGGSSTTDNPTAPANSTVNTTPADTSSGANGNSTNATATNGAANTPADNTASTATGTATTSTTTDSATTSTDTNANSNDSQLHVKKGSENDVDAIGNRKVGARGLGDWYSTESEIQMGKRYAQQVEQTVRLVQDPIINEYVNRIGQNIVRNSDAKVPFTIKVVDSEEINAFALPGGFFYVNSGLVLAADNEAELAGVMAHEIAHVCARHAMRQLTRAQWVNIGSIPLIFVGGGLGYAISSAASLALPFTFLKFSRNFESEADYLGLQYMYKTGYDPQAFIDFFEKLQAQEKKKPGTLARAFASHPQTPDRIQKSQEEINKILPSRPQYVVTTSEFDDVKARLAVIENRHKLIDRSKDKDKNKPTLRRTTTADNGGDDTKKGGNDDDRPTLQRRDQ